METGKFSDRALILMGLLISAISGSLLIWDRVSSSVEMERAGAIGFITHREGDARLKLIDTHEWASARYGQQLLFDDTLFSGKSSSIKIRMQKSDMEISENSLVVLRRQGQGQLLDLSYGSVIAKLSKGHSLTLKQSGKSIDIKAMRKASFIVKKADSQLNIEVQSGALLATTPEEKIQIDPLRRLELSSVKAELIEPKIELVDPPTTVYSNVARSVPLSWEAPPGHYLVEVSQSPTFANFETIPSEDPTTQLPMSSSTRLFYRVRHKDLISNIHQLDFVLVKAPRILEPKPGATYYVPPAYEKTVALSVASPKRSVATQLQLAKDENFETLVLDETTTSRGKELPVIGGTYYFRARSIYAENTISPWSPTRRFEVLTPKSPSQRIALPTTLTIPVGTPMSREEVGQLPLFRDFFRETQNIQTQVRIQGQRISNIGWPAEKIHAGIHQGSYRTRQPGYDYSNWQRFQTQISHQSPRQTHVIWPEPTVNTHEDHKLSWSHAPLSSGYDFELSTDPGFQRSKVYKLKTSSVSLKSRVDKTYYWRVRVLGESGTPSSEYSPTYSYKIPKLESLLAQSPPPPVKEKRAIANTKETTTRLEDLYEKSEAIRKGPWSIWAGGGFNFVNFDQLAAQRGKFTSQNLQGPSSFVEASYKNLKYKVGATASYKSTPGEVIVDNKAIDRSDYIWTTLSFEAIYQRLFPRKISGYDFEYGVRAGVQDHVMPFVEVSAPPDLELFLKQINIQTASLGFLTDLRKGRYRYHLSLRLQSPINSGTAEGSLEIIPKISFDGSIGASYVFPGGFKLGWFMYGQMHDFEYQYNRGTNTLTGTETLLFSNMDLRVGYEF